MNALLEPFATVPTSQDLTREAIEQLEGAVPCFFMMALIWSVGATCTNEGRLKFDAVLRKMMKVRHVRLQGALREAVCTSAVEKRLPRSSGGRRLPRFRSDERWRGGGGGGVLGFCCRQNGGGIPASASARNPFRGGGTLPGPPPPPRPKGPSWEATKISVGKILLGHFGGFWVPDPPSPPLLILPFEGDCGDQGPYRRGGGLVCHGSGDVGP